MPYILSPGETLSLKEFEKILKRLTVDGGGKWNTPLGAEELLEIGRETFEPLFHQPPLGPVPEHLKPHRSVHGCVTEYEEKLEELERWKVQMLDLWLRDKVGKKFPAGEKVYELCIENKELSVSHKYWLKPIQDRIN
jgi:hypothetical protein